MEDRFGHRISYLRVSITDRCNERCTYCMPQELQEWLPRHDILTFEETLRLIRIASELGVTKIRLTGGEPLTRRDVIQLFRQLPGLTSVRDIGLSTNGTLLARELEPGLTMAEAVRACGFNSVNISLDTLDRDGVCACYRSRSITRSDRGHRRGHRGRFSAGQRSTAS